jgi:hypothetical protein
VKLIETLPGSDRSVLTSAICVDSSSFSLARCATQHDDKTVSTQSI